jgi:hypothetical protein
MEMPSPSTNLVCGVKAPRTPHTHSSFATSITANNGRKAILINQPQGIGEKQMNVYIKNMKEQNSRTTVKINGKEMPANFFQDFNWPAFNRGDTVHLDDCDDTNYLTARYQLLREEEGGRVVYLTALGRSRKLKSSYHK